MNTESKNASSEPAKTNYTKLGQVLREKADAIQERHELGDDIRLDATELLRVLARIVEGKEIHRAFGAPGDWGYNTPIGASLAEAYRGGAR